MATRQLTRHAIFGDSCDLPQNVLPTNLQVAKRFLQLKERRNDCNKDKYKTVADDVVGLWDKASIPTIQNQSVVKRVEVLITTGAELCRSKSSCKRKADFQSNLDSLFDIAACKCLMSYNDSTKEVTLSCKCPRESKVPQMEQLFLLDQRNSRRMFIGGVDVVATTSLQRRLKRKNDNKERLSTYRPGEAEKLRLHMLDASKTYSSEDDNDDSEKHLSDSDFLPTTSAEAGQMRIPLQNLAKEADRYGISDRATASLATAVLIDFGIITKDDQSLVIDKNKVRRERIKLRKTLHKDVRQTSESITAIYFDGRKDKTLSKVMRDNKWLSDVTIEEHYVLLVEPSGEYLTHVTPTSGKSIDISSSIISVISDQGATDTFCATGCDSTNVNTGSKAGVIRQIELSLGRPVNWFICMLHTNELPLRHLFTHLDGVTSGATSFTGPIGKALQTCESKPIVQFQPIICRDSMPILDEEVLDDLSSDQIYLYNIINTIKSGTVSDNLSWRKPGVLNHARWLTLANRVCRLYIATQNPTDNLRLITHFIVSNYGPNWFAIKRFSLCTDGAKHVYLATQLLKDLSSDTAAIVKPYISRSAYFAHCENLLLAMLADSDEGKRSRAVDIILKCRSKDSGTNVRQFSVPPINYDAKDWVELIDWVNASEPPVTMRLSNEEIGQFREIPLTLKYPNHTQCVERSVKLVTEASRAVYGFDARDGFIRARVHSRSLMPQYDSKQDYANNFLCSDST